MPLSAPRVASTCIALFLPVLACNGDDHTRQPEASPEISPTTQEPDVEFACPNQRAALEAEGEGSLTGDVDGDGALDDVTLVEDPDGPAGCRAFLVASSDPTLSAPIEQEGMTTELGLPALRGLVQLDDRDGFEVIVGLVAGASTEFFGGWTVRDGRLERIEITGGDVVGDLFPSGGSVGHVEASDCVPGGGVVVSVGVPRGDGYRVTRDFYSFDGAPLTLERSERERIEGAAFDRFPEFIASPFGSCSHP